MPDDTPGIGHNQPAPADEFDTFKDRVELLKATANKWAGERPEITDDDMAGKARDFLDQIRAEANAIEDARKAANEPFRKIVTANNEKYNGLAAVLEKVKEILSPRLTKWLEKKEAERKAREKAAAEEAEKLKREAEALAEAAAKQTDGDIVGGAMQAEAVAEAAEAAVKTASTIARSKVAVKGDLGGRAAGLRTTYYGEITDMNLVYRRFCKHPKVAEVLLQLVNADIRAGVRRIHGVTIKSKSTAH